VKLANWQRFALGVAAGLGLVGLVYGGWIATFVYTMATMPCGYEVQQEAVSPDHREKAAVVEVNCGATTPYMDWAVIAPVGRAYDFEKDRVASAYGQEMRVAWEERKLVVLWRMDNGHPERPAQLSQGAGKDIELRRY
jgi:hypothetical protein